MKATNKSPSIHYATRSLLLSIFRSHDRTSLVGKRLWTSTLKLQNIFNAFLSTFSFNLHPITGYSHRPLSPIPAVPVGKWHVKFHSPYSPICPSLGQHDEQFYWSCLIPNDATILYYTQLILNAYKLNWLSVNRAAWINKLTILKKRLCTDDTKL